MHTDAFQCDLNNISKECHPGWEGAAVVFRKTFVFKWFVCDVTWILTLILVPHFKFPFTGWVFPFWHYLLIIIMLIIIPNSGLHGNVTSLPL